MKKVVNFEFLKIYFYFMGMTDFSAYIQMHWVHAW